MRDGFVKVAAGTPEIRVADCRYNAEQIFTLMREADKQGVRVLALPELCLTGYTCGDLFLQDTLLKGAEEGLATILEATKNLDMLTALGLPVKNPWDGKLYNCAAVIHKGEILGLVPKTYVPNYGEFYEGRWFTSGKNLDVLLNLCGQQVSIWDREIWACDTMPDLVVGVEICEDLWASMPPSVALAQAGATVILNLSASDEVVGKADYRRTLVTGQSARLLCGYVYANAGEGESTTDLVFSGHNLIAENGALLAERRFASGLSVSEIDVGRLAYERRRMNTFIPPERDPMGEAHCLGICRTHFSLEPCTTTLTRPVSPLPFIPEDAGERRNRCEEIILLSALGLKKRLEHTGAKAAVVGLSGGLDSTLAILITAVAMKLLDRPASDIIAVTMPCFGTTDRTRDNAVELAAVLRDILATPVSPELLPPKEGEIAQKTEDLVGPYELHDFFLYYAVRWGFSPRKVFRLARYALGDRYDRETILKWLNNFYRRFFAQQFKRSCLPDGPKVGSLTLSPRGDWRMPSDAVNALWRKELEELGK